MNAILAIPLVVRIAGAFLLGTVVAGFINLGVYTLAWQPRAISPWSAAPRGARVRRWRDRLPIVGWWALKRESSLHGRGFWLRPLLVEVVAGTLFAALYYWTVHAPDVLVLGGDVPRADFLSANLALAWHVQYAGHLVLVSLMIVASLIDIDEKTIPDAITVSGALVGLVLACVYPWSLLPNAYWPIFAPRNIEFLTLASPESWPDALGGWPLPAPLAIALACWTLWCGGLLPRRFNTRRGLKTALRVFFHRLRVESITYWIAALWLVGAVAIGVVYRAAPAAHWAGLLTALVGVAGGGGITWLVRTVGTVALRKEAMGFGDVTLMSMIGAFLGWQAAVIVFFLAPFFGLVVGVVERLTHGENEIPYGPSLCLAALIVMVKWPLVWQSAHATFALGWVLPVLLAICLVLMGIMLWSYRVVARR